ncbi:hypothetical protein [Streptantibioticus ferralitis]|uniref:Uncharacterized protein n=1 Tax=Streptantibioticus ferralitis TaxID=236510 RepID=A0ABT5YZ93_9ACTN|nr:hypothetical protein [Streptantibioticus ferralitis]MDF2256636.1 hypothetical protein [Streptantibioticus ferralitis]
MTNTSPPYPQESLAGRWARAGRFFEATEYAEAARLLVDIGKPVVMGSR